MALFGGKRDISLFRGLNRELLWDFISQQCVYYKIKLNETKVNMYGEAAGSRYYYEPVILNALIARSDQEFPQDDLVGVDFQWGVDFRFFRDDLVDAQVVPEVGDIIMWHENYYEVDNVTENQLFLGKDNAYSLTDYGSNFGASVSLILECHLTRSSKVAIVKDRI